MTTTRKTVFLEKRQAKIEKLENQSQYVVKMLMQNCIWISTAMAVHMTYTIIFRTADH